MKINRRMLKIALVCAGIAVLLTFLLYNTLKKSANPEATQSIAYFKNTLEKDTILKVSDMIFRETPVSLIPLGAINNSAAVEGKRLLYRSIVGEMVMPSKLIERGDVLVDVKELWTIGLDIVNISSFLGGNVKEGKYYALLYRDPISGSIRTLGKVKVSGLIDANSRLITKQGDGVAKTINVSVENQELLNRIAKAKGLGNAVFELVDTPEGKEVIQEDFEIIKPNTKQ